MIICGLMIFAAKRGKANKKSVKEMEKRAAKEDQEFEKRMKKLDQLH